MKKSIALAVILLLIAAGGWYVWDYNAKSRVPSLEVVKYPQGGYRLDLDGKPFLVKGFCYNPIPVGKSYDYNFWADPGKPWITDGKLMKKMGANAVRLYRVQENTRDVKRVIDDLYRKFGIRTFVGDYLGFWDWPPANYASASFQEEQTKRVVEMVRTYKDEPGIIGWILGNENNYSFDQALRSWSNDEIDAMEDPEARRIAKAKIYYTFVNNVAKEIRKIDPVHPIVLGIGEVKSLDVAAELTPDIDILGVIAYRGATFGNLFRQIKQKYDKPVLMTEFGADRFNAYTNEEDQENQARFVELQWKDIVRNSTVDTGVGNAIGGLVFEWHDEWWKSNEGLAHTWGIHDRSAQWSHSSYYYDYEAPGRLNINEEWWGVVGLNPRAESAKSGIDQRVLKKAYYALKEVWTQPTEWVAPTQSSGS